MARPLGIIAWEGPSPIDGAPIAVILVGVKPRKPRGKNRKTGEGMLQTHIIRTDITPLCARGTAQDAAICGSCPLRGGSGCYVRVEQAPTGIYKAFHRGRYMRVSGPAELKRVLAHLYPDGVKIRFGSYGDPAMVPAWVWTALLTVAINHTGYTHQWRDLGAHMQGFLMASVHTTAERAEAKSQGFRTFRTGTGEAGPGEVLCPASEEAGRRVTCDNCCLCSGTKIGAGVRDVFIPLHGAKAKTAKRALLAIG